MITRTVGPEYVPIPTCSPTDRKLKIHWNGSNGFPNGREEAVGLLTGNGWKTVSVRVSRQ